MAIFVEGVRGSGKTKIAVSEIQIYLKSNRRVATNLDIDIYRLAPNSTSECVRLPDIPRSLDLEQLGKAYPELDPDDPATYDESKFGLIVIDELLVSFNSRSWNDSDRLKLVQWMVQSRKLGWRLWLICQDVDAVDKQLRETLLQEIWACRSGKNFFSSPVLGKLLNLIISPILKIVSPQGFHICKVFTGKKKDKINLAQTFFFKRYDLHPCYKTSQTFTLDNYIDLKGNVIDARASYCMLPSNYFERLKNLPNKNDSIQNNKDLQQPFIQKNKSLIVKSILLVGCVFGYFSFKSSDDVSIPDPTVAISTSVSGVSNLENASKSAYVMPQPDIPDLYITCSVVKSDDTGDYCFEYQGKPFDPVMVGYQVRYIAPCRAGLIDGDRMFIATCNPISVKSESVKANEPPQTQELQQNVAT